MYRAAAPRIGAASQQKAPTAPHPAPAAQHPAARPAPQPAKPAPHAAPAPAAPPKPPARPPPPNPYKPAHEAEAPHDMSHPAAMGANTTPPPAVNGKAVVHLPEMPGADGKWIPASTHPVEHLVPSTHIDPKKLEQHRAKGETVVGVDEHGTPTRVLPVNHPIAQQLRALNSHPQTGSLLNKLTSDSHGAAGVMHVGKFSSIICLMESEFADAIATVKEAAETAKRVGKA